MEIGIGLPATLPGVDGETLIEWARRAEGRGFSTLGVIDRIVYGNYEPLVALAAAAAVTERIRLTTSILLAPLRTNHALFAKQAASLDRLSGGRLELGLAVGIREDDYTESGVDFHERGRQFDALLERVSEIWARRPRTIGPDPAGGDGPTLLLGGMSPAAYRRMASFGAGWIAGGGGPEAFRGGAEQARQAWAEAGREGAPRLLALGYFALGDGAGEHAKSYLSDYYGFAGPYAEQVVAGALTEAEQVAERMAAMSAVGCDELIIFPCTADLEQVDLLADAAGL